MYPNSSYQSNQYQVSDRPTSSQSTFSNGAYNHQGGTAPPGVVGDRSNYAGMYAQQQNGLGGGAGGGQWAQNGGGGQGQSFAQQAQYAGNGSQQQYSQGPSATANLFQQQLAQQSSMAPSQNSLAQPPHAANSYQSSAQAYMQSQQQLAQARGAPQGSPHPSSFPTSSQSPASSFSQIPNQMTTQSQQTPSHDQSNPPPRSNSMQALSAPQLMEVLRGVSLQGMTPQIYSNLTPIQQHAVQEIMARTRTRQAQQQSQLGLGLPGSPAAQKQSPSSNQPPSNGTPAPNPSTLNRPTAAQPSSQQATPSQLTFLKTLSDFYAKRGTTFNGPPVIEGRQIDLPRLYAAVSSTGGFVNTNARRLWGTVASACQFPAASVEGHPEQRLQQIASAYHTALYAFEQAFQALQQQRMQAARAAASQASSNAVANSVPIPFANPPATAPTPSAQSTSHASPAPQQVPQPLANSPIATQPSRPASSGSASTSNLQNASLQMQPNVESKVPPTFDTRPGSASSRRDSVVVEDIKGKGKAVEVPETSIKVEDFATNGSTTPKNNTVLDLPDSTASASPRPVTADPSKTKPAISLAPPPPVEPPRRKRQKIEYVPYNKPLDTVAGYDLGGVEEVYQQTARRKRPRTAYDLGLVDLHSLTMSIRSRLASEVSFALNSLTLISMSIRTHPQETNSIPFPLRRCQNLYDELVDLLEETAFGYEEDDENEEEVVDRNGTSDRTSAETYTDLFQTITEEAGRLRPPDPDERNRNAQLADLGQTPLRPIDIILSVTNILRNFSIAEDNANFLGKDTHLLEVLARLTKLALETSERGTGGGTKRPLWPIRLSPLDLMTLRKDVLELLVNFGLEVRLDQQDIETSQSLFDLLTFFLLDAHRHSHVHFDLSQTPGNSSRIVQPTSVRIAHYVDLGLAAFSRVTLADSNRITLSRLASHATLDRLFDSLIRLVPISESDFQLMTLESGLVFVENLVMSLYNLVYLATPELKLELRSKPAYIRSLMRVVRRLSGSHSSDSAAAAFQPLIERCIATLQLLSSLGGVTVGSTGIESTEVPWWGMSMSGWEEDEVGEGGKQVIRPAQPTEADRGIVKQRLPPSASAASGLEPGLPILSGDTKSLFESLAAGSMSSVFSSLVTLL